MIYHIFVKNNFHVSFVLSLIDLSSWFYWLHDFCTLYISFVYSWFWFMSLYEFYRFLSIDFLVVFIYYGIYICFIPFLKDFVLVFKIIIKLVSYSSIGRVFKYVKRVSNLIFENPYHPRTVGWAIMSCVLYWNSL